MSHMPEPGRSAEVEEPDPYAGMRRFWADRFDALVEVLEAFSEDQPPPDPHEQE